MTALPLLPTMGVGSYAAPGWFIAVRRMMRDGLLGSHDIQEMLDDATRVVLADQVEAGVDIFTDGELRRQRFVFEVYDQLQGLRRISPARRLGIAGYDMAPHFAPEGRVTAPNGLGTVDDFRALRALLPDRPVKIAIPGPLTFAEFIDAEPQQVEPLWEDILTIVRAELQALVEAGADYIQLDEPALPRPPVGNSPEDSAAFVNRALEGLPGRLAVHVCFGNNAGRPFADRRMGRLVAAMERLECHQLVLEFANREMGELEVIQGLASKFDIAVGVIDVKNFHLESAEDVAGRIEQCLAYVPAEKLTVTADCGFSALPRYLARQKLEAMVGGARLARERLG